MCERTIIAAQLLAITGTSLAQPVPDYDFDWAIVGDPGNRATLPHEVPLNPNLRLGSVDHRYRVARHEVTVGQWFEFVQAYAPHYQGSPNASYFTSTWIRHDGNDYVMQPGAEGLPTSVGWRMAARYMNWLHNGKGTDRASFESGVYDASTFSQNPDGSFNDQAVHDPDSRFWLPTQDEWTKAMYYDPSKNGVGQEGYWRYPHSSDVHAVSGYPWEGGETNAGIPFVGDVVFLDVGSYPQVASPWGLLDGSGGAREWTGSWIRDGARQRIWHGSMWFEPVHDIADGIDNVLAGLPDLGTNGFRVASIVPNMGTCLFFGVSVCLLTGRRRVG